jgi:hypothetical protein
MKCIFNITLLSIAVLCAASCNQLDRQSSCRLDTYKIIDAFDYPNLVGKSDTDILAYQLKNVLTPYDSFIYVTYGMAYLKKFDEPNLSLRPLRSETFRFFYDPWGGPAIDIRFDESEMTIKVRTKGIVAPILNKNKLDSLERIKLNFLEWNHFSKKEKFPLQRMKYYDSMTKIYPELLSTKYYKSLYDKAVDYDSLKFEYQEKKIKFTGKQYCDLIDSLNSTEFSKLPWTVNYPAEVADGGGYSFEANTIYKYKMFVCYGLPIHTLKLTNFCRNLIELADLDKKVSF